MSAGVASHFTNSVTSVIAVLLGLIYSINVASDDVTSIPSVVLAPTISSTVVSNRVDRVSVDPGRVDAVSETPIESAIETPIKRPAMPPARVVAESSLFLSTDAANTTPSPTSQKPRHVMIREWLTLAQPVSNATDGSNFMYNPWGQIIGTAVSGDVLIADVSPQSSVAICSEDYVWALRSRLDSVDHCTLDEYVSRRLADEPVSHCIGRYGPTAVDVTGLNLREAREQLARRKLNIAVKAGEPAPDELSARKIQKQEPVADARLNRGDIVTVWLYTDFMAQVEIPDLMGMHIETAVATAANLGLEPIVKNGSQIHDNGLWQVNLSAPSAGTTVAPGSKIYLSVTSQDDTQEQAIQKLLTNDSQLDM